MGWERKARTGLGGQAAARALGTDDQMPREIRKALKRARKMSPSACIEWADGALATIGRNLAEHAKHPGSGDYLRAAQSDAAVLWACLEAAVTTLPEPPPLDRLPSAALGVASVRQG